MMESATAIRIQRHHPKETHGEPSGPAPAQSLLPLWLTQQEAEAVLLLCSAASTDADPAVEAQLFGKLGEVLRAFQR